MTYRDVTRPICIIGLGLIGGSLLRDLVAAGHPAYGYTQSTSGMRAAVKEGFEATDNLDKALTRAEEDAALVVVAAPMGAVEAILDAVAEHAPSCGITDVVSVKTPVYEAIKARGLESRYVGGHPMAGTEFSGWKASHSGLFHRAAWVVTYDYAAELEEAGQRVPQSWTDLFSDVVRMIINTKAEAIPTRVANHDAAVARVSHLPHVLANTLSVVGDNGGTLAQSLAAGSFKDATRVAGTEPELQRAMCESNSEALVSALDETIELLQQARASLAQETPSVAELVESGHRARTRLEARSGAREESVSPIKISSRPVLRLHPGGPGWVRQLSQTEDLGGRIEIY